MEIAQDSSASAYPPGNPTFVKGYGINLVDDCGTEYMDAVAGTFNHTLGYGHIKVTEAVCEVLKSGLCHLSSAFTHPEVEGAHADLVAIAPPNLDRCHSKGSTGGSTAIEQAIRTAWCVTRKTSLMTFRNSHHGQTLATTSVSGMPFRKDRIRTISLPVVQVPAPDCYRCPVGKRPETCKLECVETVEQALDHPPGGEGDFAAMIAEPILGAGGGNCPPSRLLVRIARAAQETRCAAGIRRGADVWANRPLLCVAVFWRRTRYDRFGKGHQRYWRSWRGCRSASFKVRDT